MHLHGRALVDLADRAVADLDDPDAQAHGVDAFEITEGELVAGLALGWNFGDGHLTRTAPRGAAGGLSVRARRGARRPARVAAGGAAPTCTGGSSTPAVGLIDEGRVTAAELLDRQPWGSPVAPA